MINSLVLMVPQINAQLQIHVSLQRSCVIQVYGKQVAVKIACKCPAAFIIEGHVWEAQQ